MILKEVMDILLYYSSDNPSLASLVFVYGAPFASKECNEVPLIL